MRLRQWKVLYRQFLFRIVDLDVLSPDAQGDATRLLGQFASLLVFLSVLGALGALLGGRSGGPEAQRYVLTLIAQHFLIATTMLTVGLFAVLSWDATFPDRRDVLVLAPLPVRTGTMFLAKVAAAGSALGLTVLLLHSAMGLLWPANFAFHARPTTILDLSFSPTPAGIPVGDLPAVMTADMPPLAPTAGIAIGIWRSNERQIMTYGAARPDSLFEIGSISKTFTGLLLARMVAEGKARYDEPVRELLPAGTVAKPPGPEITLFDLATHRSGLPRMPPNFRPADRTNPYADYDPPKLYAYLKAHGVAKTPSPDYRYSNLGLGLLGQALAERAGKSYTAHLRDQITAPLGLADTTVQLSPEQRKRFLKGHNDRNFPVPSWDLDALAGAGAIRSTAGDMLTYLAANLHPERYPALQLALANSHRLRANAAGGSLIALAWHYSPEDSAYYHSGATAGFTAYAAFSPPSDTAIVVLSNSGPNFHLPPELIASHIRQRLAGIPAVSLRTTQVPAPTGAIALFRSYAAYWITMFAAGLFVYAALLSLQGLAAQLLPRQLFLRISGYLQLAAFCAIVLFYFFQPGFGGLNDLTAASVWRVMNFLPSYWFLALYQQLNGTLHPALAPLALRACQGLATAVFVASASYALSYWRTLHHIVEEPDIVPGARRLGWLPRFGSQRQTAIGQFAVRTLVRSRQHRMILAFYLGLGLAFTSLLLKDPATKRQFDDASLANPWSEASIAPWAASVIMMILAILGTRVVFALPLDLRANWALRLTGFQSGPATLAASRRALFLTAVFPVWILEAAICLALWPAWQTASHLAALAILGLIVVEISLLGFRKIPFACSYLPGKTKFHLMLLGSVALAHGTIQAVLWEHRTIQQPHAAFMLVTVLGVLYTAVRVANRHQPLEPMYEELDAPAVQTLGLNRDGYTPISSGTTL